MMKRLCIFLLLMFPWITFAINAPKNDIEVKVFANTAIVSVYDFNFNNMIPRQKQAATHFTANGWINFSKALTQSKLLDAVKKNRYEVSAVAMRPPKIIHQGLSSGTYRWKVMMPTMVVYKNDTKEQVQYLNVTLEIYYQRGRLLINNLISEPGEPLVCEKDSSNQSKNP